IALNLAILGAALKPGDVVYVSPFEHNSVLRPLAYLRKTIGIQIELLPFHPQTFECQLDEVKRLFRYERPSMVCVSMASNVVGFLLPVEDIALLAKEANPAAVILVDGAQAAGL